MCFESTSRRPFDQKKFRVCFKVWTSMPKSDPEYCRIIWRCFRQFNYPAFLTMKNHEDSDEDQRMVTKTFLFLLRASHKYRLK